jgi:hypothetical protein
MPQASGVEVDGWANSSCAFLGCGFGGIGGLGWMRDGLFWWLNWHLFWHWLRLQCTVSASDSIYVNVAEAFDYCVTYMHLELSFMVL